MEEVYYVSIACTIAFNLYIIIIATLSNVRAQRMALHGHVDQSVIKSELPASLGYTPGMIGDGGTPTRAPSVVEAGGGGDDVQRAISALRSVQPSLLLAFGAGLSTFTVGATAMVWIKTEEVRHEGPAARSPVASHVTAVFAVLLLVTCVANMWLHQLFSVRRYHESTLEASPAVQPVMSDLREPLNR